MPNSATLSRAVDTATKCLAIASFSEASSVTMPRSRRPVSYTHLDVYKRQELSLNSTNCAALRQLQFAVQFSVEDYLNSYLNADAGPALTAFRTSFEPYLRQLSDAGVDISRMAPPMGSR